MHGLAIVIESFLGESFRVSPFLGTVAAPRAVRLRASLLIRFALPPDTFPFHSPGFDRNFRAWRNLF
jgi:hypothetical protein